MMLSVIMTSITILVCTILMCLQLGMNRRERALVSFSTLRLPVCVIMIALMALAGLSAGRNAIYLLPCSLTVGIFPLWLLASGFLSKSSCHITICVVLEMLCCLVYLMDFLMWESSFPPSLYITVSVIVVLVYIFYFLISFWLYIRRIRNIVRKTTTWTMLVMSVDVIYLLFLVVEVVGIYLSYISGGPLIPYIVCFCTFLMLAMVVATCYRISSDSLFFVMRKHENIILESINDIPDDIISEGSSADDGYKEIFSRVVAYFESEKPYLNGNLLIDDLVKVVYANKLYISRSISRYAGKNFCQFVNHYRVKHSIDVFRDNPELKVAELALQVGFNSVVSFTSAFKLHMNDNPSDWMRQERNRLSKSRSGR